jgi:uncharacterized protein YutE (UPF0331/DUF86 family)
VISPEDLDSIEDPLELFKRSSEAISQHQEAIDQLADIRAHSIAALYVRGASYKELANTLDLSTPRVGQLVSTNDAAAIEVLKAWAAIEQTLMDLIGSPVARQSLYNDALQILRRSKRFDKAASRDLAYLRQIRNAIVHGRQSVTVEDAERIADKALYLEPLMRTILFDLQTKTDLTRGERGTRWRVFVSHTSELREFPRGRSYVEEVERAISAAGHVIVDMADFPAADQPAAQLCVDRVRGCEVYVGVLGTRYGSLVRDRPEVSYTELEFDTATEAGLDLLVFLLDTDAADVGIPVSALIDPESGGRQETFRRRVQESGLVTQSFTDPATLGRLVERSLRELSDARRHPASRVVREQTRKRKNRLLPGESLLVGQSLYSLDGRTRFALNQDGNMVVYRQGLEDISDTGTGNLGEPKCLTLEEDGWLILYDVDGNELWKQGPGGVRLEVQDNSHVVLYPAKGDAIWATEFFVKAAMLMRWRSPQGERRPNGPE